MLGTRQIQQKRRPAVGDQPDAAAVAIEKRQRHRVDRGFCWPMALVWTVIARRIKSLLFHNGR